MTHFGQASRTKDLIGIALISMMMVLLWVNSALATDRAAHTAPDAVGAVTGEVGTTGSIGPVRAEHL